MPLLARQAYQGGAGLYATLQVTFTMGIVVANFVVSRQKNTFKKPRSSDDYQFSWAWRTLVSVSRPAAELLGTLSGDFCLGSLFWDVDDARAHDSSQSGSPLAPIAGGIGLSALPIWRCTAGCLGLWICDRAGRLGADLYGYRGPDTGSLGNCGDPVTAMVFEGD